MPSRHDPQSRGGRWQRYSLGSGLLVHEGDLRQQLISGAADLVVIRLFESFMPPSEHGYLARNSYVKDFYPVEHGY